MSSNDTGGGAPDLDDNPLTKAQTARFRVAVAAFRKEFCRDKKVLEQLQDWRERCGIEAEIRRCAAALNAAADLAGLENATHFFRAGADPRVSERDLAAYTALLNEGGAALEAILTKPDVPFDLGREAARFLAKLELRYLWLVPVLSGEFHASRVDGLWAILIPDSIKRNGSIELGAEWILKQLPGEGALKTRQRLDQEYELIRVRLSAAATPEEALSEEVRLALERKAVWFYRSRVRRDPILDTVSAIARDHYPDAGHKRRKDVRDGIGVVKKLFDLTADKLPKLPP